MSTGILGKIVLGSGRLGESSDNMDKNTMEILHRMQDSFPHIYDVYNENTILYALLYVYGIKYGKRTNIIDRLYAMIGIDSTYDEDLEWRWGTLLGVPKQTNESYLEYRNRLKVVYPSLSGGTANAIKHAIASAAGIESDIDQYVSVYDAWEYPYDIDMSLLGIDEVVDETSLYGSIICTLDLSMADAVDHINVVNAINHTKASGINPYLIFLYNENEDISLLRNADEHNDIISRDLLESCAIYNTSATAVFGNAIFDTAIFGNRAVDTSIRINVDMTTNDIKETLDGTYSINKSDGTITDYITSGINDDSMTFRGTDEILDKYI